MRPRPEVPFLDLSRRARRTETEVAAALERVRARGWYVLGVEAEAFEREFAASLGAAHAVGVNSGTDALALALVACGIRPGDGVVTAANTAVPTVCAIVQAGAVPILADVDTSNYCLDPDALRAVVRRRPDVRGVIPVHLYGHAAPMGAILDVAREFGLTVVEDAAQAHGATLDGRPLGTFGDAAGFSFYPTKNLGALGDAGAVVTNDPTVAERVRMLRNYGEVAKYENQIRGVNSRLDEIQAAVLRATLPALETWVRERREIALRYDEAFAGLGDLVAPRSAPGVRHAYHLYVVRSKDRDDLRGRLKERGIGTAVHYPRPVHHQAAYRDLGRDRRDLAVSERASAEIVSLPLYPELTPEEVDAVADAVRTAARGEG